MKSLKEMEKEIVVNMENVIKQQQPEAYNQVEYMGFQDSVFKFKTRDENTQEQAIFSLNPYRFSVSVRCENTKSIDLEIGIMDEKGQLV